MKLHELKPNKNSRKRRKVVGRGLGSGHGTYSGRGAKGQKARTGGKIRPGFEGGRMPFIRQVPKRRGKGFKGNPVKMQVVNLADLAANFSDNDKVTPEGLFERGLVTDPRRVKVLGTGDLGGRKLVIENVLLTKSAKEAILKTGGKVEEAHVAESAEK
ncbi:MAG: 50S ribosomal protein L15 [Candidatus Doudnabacteria bacterium RIFCSPHIGHO2_02_FULL_46_11]|uniref:Large ribosomal subunit protein uL15 n=1 Tax=Candidatus Doudnabacteria bacterium RIFCSPHIGHO2_02_FULL_46_11 TaxID=1817832 RepID=A0A1F5P5J1_9BACT|nr:MAG: 50S ribosomal protein L15 [Candidatus Doudnabacteria bacterium RIFCSPHIGHO2_02_FULL_46_11]